MNMLDLNTRLADLVNSVRVDRRDVGAFHFFEVKEGVWRPVYALVWNQMRLQVTDRLLEVVG